MIRALGSRRSGEAALLFLLVIAIGFACDSADAARRKHSRSRQDHSRRLQATGELSYYGGDFYERVSKGDHGDSLRKLLWQVLVGAHVKQDGGPDVIREHCPDGARGCYGFRRLGYEEAREALMGDISLERRDQSYFVTDVYCEHPFTARDFPTGRGPGPNRAPDSKILNTEHTWPQSRFNPKENQNVQKTDLHHLYPSESQMNSIRGSFKFAEVEHETQDVPCDTSKFGMISKSTDHYFEPPNSHKGNVARALFYFAVRYRMQIDPEEEFFLRRWNERDPVDQAEMARQELIFEIQHDRNPFIDYPELVERIADF